MRMGVEGAKKSSRNLTSVVEVVIPIPHNDLEVRFFSLKW